MLVQQAVGELAAGALDGVGLGFALVALPGAQRPVGARAGELHHAVGPGQLHVHRAPGEREVLERPLGVYAVQALRRHGDLAEQITLHAHVVAHGAISVPIRGRQAPNTIFWTCTPSTSLSLAFIASASSSAPKNSMSTTPLGEHTLSLASCRPMRVLMLQPYW